MQCGRRVHARRHTHAGAHKHSASTHRRRGREKQTAASVAREVMIEALTRSSFMPAPVLVRRHIRHCPAPFCVPVLALPLLAAALASVPIPPLWLCFVSLPPTPLPVAWTLLPLPALLPLAFLIISIPPLAALLTTPFILPLPPPVLPRYTPLPSPRLVPIATALRIALHSPVDDIHVPQTIAPSTMVVPARRSVHTTPRVAPMCIFTLVPGPICGCSRAPTQHGACTQAGQARQRPRTRTLIAWLCLLVWTCMLEAMHAKEIAHRISPDCPCLCSSLLLFPPVKPGPLLSSPHFSNPLICLICLTEERRQQTCSKLVYLRPTFRLSCIYE